MEDPDAERSRILPIVAGILAVVLVVGLVTFVESRSEADRRARRDQVEKVYRGVEEGLVGAQVEQETRGVPLERWLLE